MEFDLTRKDFFDEPAGGDERVGEQRMLAQRRDGYPDGLERVCEEGYGS